MLRGLWLKPPPAPWLSRLDHWLCSFGALAIVANLTSPIGIDEKGAGRSRWAYTIHPSSIPRSAEECRVSCLGDLRKQIF